MKRRARNGPRVLLVMIIVVGAYFGWRQYERRFIFQPDPMIAETPAKFRAPFENVNLRAPDGVNLFGWYVPSDPDAEQASATAESPPTVLFFEEQAGNISRSLAKVKLLHELGLNVFLFDYRGYGKSGGQPSERGLNMDALAAYFYLVEQRKVAPERLFFFGDGLGAAVAVALATKVKAAGLIAEAPFTSLADLAEQRQSLLPWRWLLENKFETIDKIAFINMPLLVLHNGDDERAPLQHAEHLMESARDPKELFTFKSKNGLLPLSSDSPSSKKIASFIHQYTAPWRSNASLRPSE